MRIATGLSPRVLFPVSAALFATAALAAPPIPSPLRAADVPAPVLRLVMNADAYAALKDAGAATISDFPLPDGTSVDLDVSPLEIFTPDAVVVLGTAHGDLALPRPDHLLLSGTITGEPDSSVYLSLSLTAVNGYLIRPNETFIVSSGPFGAGLDPVIYNTTQLPEGAITFHDTVCGTDRLPRRPRPALPDGPSTREAPCREVLLAIESDWEYCDTAFNGNTAPAAAYAATLYGAISEIYKRDLNTTLKVGFVRVWGADVDPYVGGDILDRIYMFHDQWNANMTAVQRNAAQMLSGVAFGSIGGAAYYPGVCNVSNDYAITGYINGFFPYPLADHRDQNWDVFASAHELGHNFYAHHTHERTPPYDGCGNGDCAQAAQGTIMSYCHLCSGGIANIRLMFHSRSINEEILPYLNSLVDNQPPCAIRRTAITITDQPDSAAVFAGQNASISLAATGSSFTIKWFKNNALIPGATGTSISWTPTIIADGGSYRAVLTNSCGSVNSNTAVLTVNYCPADFNQDGFVDGIDADLFTNAFESGDMAADYNGDGFVDGIDYDQFNNDFAAGC